MKMTAVYEMHHTEEEHDAQDQVSLETSEKFLLSWKRTQVEFVL